MKRAAFASHPRILIICLCQSLYFPGELCTLCVYSQIIQIGNLHGNLLDVNSKGFITEIWKVPLTIIITLHQLHCKGFVANKMHEPTHSLVGIYLSNNNQTCNIDQEALIP